LQNIIIISVSTFLFLVFFFLNKFLWRKYGNSWIAILTFPAIMIIIIIGVSIFSFLKWQPSELLIDGPQSKIIVTFPTKPQEFYINDDVNAYKIIRDGHEFSLVYKKLISDDTALIVAERFEEKMSANDVQFILKEINDIEAYFIIYEHETDSYIFKKVVIYDSMLLDFTIQSSNQFPDEVEEAFLDYIIR